jgi:predicted RNase H-like nuclease (RuvC/YqgF family)
MMIEQGRDETMQGTVDAIAQLATATASDRGTVATLTTDNAKLATQLEAAQAKIAQLKDEIAALKSKIKPAWQGQRPIKTTNNDSYCWLHGYQVAKSHTSALRKRADTMMQQTRTTPWADSNGARNDVEGQLRLYMIN